MGLLDALNGPDGIFALGLLDAAAPKPVRTSFGGGMLQAMQQAQAWRQAQDDRKQREALQALQMQHLQVQIGETQAQAQQRQAAVQEAQRKVAEMQRQQALIAKAFAPVAPAQANAQSGIAGPRPEALNVVGSRPQVDWQQLIAQGVPAELVKHLAEAPNLGAPEVARTIDGRDAQGRPVTLQFDKQGRQIGQGVAQWKAPEKVDTGGQVQFVDPVTLANLGRFGKTQTPDSVASNSVAWANNSLARQRLNFDMQQPKGQYDADRGVMVDPRTGQASPVTMAGQPLGPKNKDLTESQGNAVAFAMRAQNALENLQRSGNIGTYDYGASRVPVVGNAMMTDKGQSAMNAEKQFLAAVLRKESGAAISQGEYDSYGAQFFARPGDDAATLEQKARNREVAIRGLRVQAGHGAGQIDSAQGRGQLAPAAPLPGQFRVLGRE